MDAELDCPPDEPPLVVEELEGITEEDCDPLLPPPLLPPADEDVVMEEDCAWEELPPPLEPPVLELLEPPELLEEPVSSSLEEPVQAPMARMKRTGTARFMCHPV